MEPPSRPAPAELPAAKPDPHRWVDEHGDCLYRYALVRVRTPGSRRRSGAGDAAGCRSVAGQVCRSFLAAKLACWHPEKQDRRSLSQAWPGDFVHRLGVSQRTNVPINLLNRASGITNLGPHEWRPEADEVMHKGEFWQTMRDCLSKLPQRVADVFHAARDGRRAGQGNLPHAEHFREQLVGHVAPRAHGVTRVSGKQLVRQGKSLEKTLMRSPAIHSPPAIPKYGSRLELLFASRSNTADSLPKDRS